LVQLADLVGLAKRFGRTRAIILFAARLGWLGSAARCRRGNGVVHKVILTPAICLGNYCLVMVLRKAAWRGDGGGQRAGQGKVQLAPLRGLPPLDRRRSISSRCTSWVTNPERFSG